MATRGGFVASEGPDYPGLARVLSVARRRWWVILAVAVACAGLAALAAGTPTYTATTRLLVGPIDGDFQDLRAGGQQSQTYAELSTTRPVLRATARRLRGEMTAQQLATAVTATADETTRLLTLTVAADTPRLAVAAAAALAAELQAETAPRGGMHPMRVVDPAAPPESGRGAKRLVALAGFAGALAALALLVVADATRRRIIDADDLAAAATAAGAVPYGVLAGARRRSRERDVRLLAARILAASDRPPRTVVIAGAPGSGGTGDAARALAAVLAEGSKVVVVDAAGDGDVDGGPAAAGLDTAAARRVRERLRRSADIVVVSAGSGTASLDWAPLADVALAVARAGRTSADALGQAIAALATGGAPVGAALAPAKHGPRRVLALWRARRPSGMRSERGTAAAVTSPSS